VLRPGTFEWSRSCYWLAHEWSSTGVPIQRSAILRARDNYIKWDTVDALPNMLTPRAYSAGVIFRSCLFVTGGRENLSGPGKIYNSMECMGIPSRGQWVEQRPVPIPSGIYHHSMVAGKAELYVIGGTTNDSKESSTLKTMYSYNFNGQPWTTLPSMSLPRKNFSACILDNIIYVFGGIVTTGLLTKTSKPSATAECYNITTKTWSKLLDIPVTIYGASVAGIRYGRSILLLGGHQNGSPSSSVYSYRPLTQTWTTLTWSLPDNRLYGCWFEETNKALIMVGDAQPDDHPTYIRFGALAPESKWQVLTTNPNLGRGIYY
jgi:hypothetical protein